MSQYDQKRGVGRLDPIATRDGLDLDDGGELEREGIRYRV
jgi:hypothetical protein